MLAIVIWLSEHPDCVVLALLIIYLNFLILFREGYYYLMFLWLSLVSAWNLLGIFREFDYWVFVTMMVDLFVTLIWVSLRSAQPGEPPIKASNLRSDAEQRVRDWENGRAGVVIFLFSELIVVLIRLYIIHFKPKWHTALWDHITFYSYHDVLFYDLIPYSSFFWAHVWHPLPLLLIPLYYTFFNYEAMCELCEEHDIEITWAEAKEYTQRVVGIFAFVYWVSHWCPTSFVLLGLMYWALRG